MGVTELWSILSPVRESVPLYSLTGKTLAVDLSLWICEAQHVQAMMGKVTKPHLRNLFFRASSLLRMGIKLVFVMEGEAPKIKAETMSKRTEMMYRGSKTKTAPKPAAAKNTSRGRFKAVLRECAEMLDCLGIPWVAAAGEAEAMCAFLDAQGLVDGCITSDGDAFLYGAQTVYRNFNMNTKDPQIDCYKTSRVESELQLKRETLVGLAVLLGCDYIPKGVAGVGKEQTLKLIQNLNGQTLLQKFSEWKKGGLETVEVAVKKVTHCLVCRHPGSAKSHERSGCAFCKSKQFCQPQDYDSQCPCDWHQTEHARQASSVETSIKKKTLACDQFPFTEIINEFLISKDKPVHTFKRRKPNLLLMQNFALAKMEWPKHYTSEKVLVLMTYTELINRRCGTESSTQMQPLRIHKRRVRNGISCFEVLWRKPDHYVFPEDSPPEDPDVVRTVEEENLFSVAYPHIIQLFHKDTAEAKDNKTKRKKPKAEKEKQDDSPDAVSHLLAQMSLQTSSVLEPSASSETVLPNITPLESTTGQKPHKDSSYQHDIQAASDNHLAKLRCESEVPSSPCHTDTITNAQSSPSVSAVLEELHLSSIDWDALSFTASPSPQCNEALRPVKISKDEDRIEHTSVIRPESGELSVSKAEHLSECPLRERVILRNVIKSADSKNNGEHVSKAKVKEEGSELKNTDLAHNFNPSCKSSNNDKVHFHSVCQKPRPCKLSPPAPAAGKKTSTTEIQQPKDSFLSQKQPKYTFVKPKQSLITSVPPLRSYSDSSYDRPPKDAQKTNHQSVSKRSVCTNQQSTSEDSDVENHLTTQQRKNKVKAKPPSKPHVLQKITSTHQLTKQEQSKIVPIQGHLNAVKTIQQSDSDTDHSDECTDSPRPLAERLKLKFLKK